MKQYDTEALAVKKPRNKKLFSGIITDRGYQHVPLRKDTNFSSFLSMDSFVLSLNLSWAEKLVSDSSQSFSKTNEFQTMHHII